MPDLTVYGKQQMLAVSFGLLPAPTLYLALLSSSANPAGSTIELAVANYVRQPVPFYAVSADQMANSGDVTFANLGAGAFLGAQLIDASTAGTPWCWVDQPGAFTIPASTDLSFPAGTLTVTRT